MSDYIDQVFAGASGNQFPSVDASREELLQQLAPQEPEEQQKQQQPASGRVAGQNTANRQVSVPGPFQVDPGTGLDAIGKFIEEKVGIPVTDLIDNVFQGDQKTPDQIADQRKQQRLETQQRGAEVQQELKQNPLSEPINVISGGVRGAGESVLNAAEVVGDTVKTFASLGNVKEDQNPFSSKYEWANWDLGKSDMGAQTGVGKVAQGFLEFGILMAGTGGFGGMAGAGAKFAAAGSALGKAGVVARAGAQGALAGLAADMISASRGEGNLSNLIKDNAPEWYPTFLTALAVDEDDSPWEAMLKTGLEGMGIGFAADAVGAFIGGSREARRILKAGGSEEEAAQAALEVSQDILDNAQPVSSTRTTLTPEQYVQELEATKASDPSMYWSVDGVDLPTASEGRVIAVEGGGGLVSPNGDIKGVYKLPDGPKGVGDAVIQEAVRQGGIKLDNFDLPNLRKIYERNGFRVTGSMPFDPQYAPPGWDEALHGKPNVVAMIYDPDKKLALPDDGFDFKDYDEMIAHRDRYVNLLGQTYRGDRSVRDQLSSQTFADHNVRLPNGNRVEFRFRTDYDIEQAYNLPEGTRVLEVSWDMGGDDQLIGTHGRRIMSDFQRLARTELDPGTVLVNFPASDGYGRGVSAAQARRSSDDVAAYRKAYLDSAVDAEMRSRMAERWDISSPVERQQIIRSNNLRLPEQASIRERLYSRAGFGPVSEEGAQLAVVRSSPDGRGRWLAPIDPSNPQSALEAINSQVTLLQRAALNAPPGRGEAMEKLLQQSRQGLPITWDDAAEVVPEYFAPGSRVITELPADVQQAHRFISQDIPTVVNFDGSVVELGAGSPHMVPLDGKALTRFTPEDWDDFLVENAELISREDTALRFTKNGGQVTAELVRMVQDPNEARFLGQLFDLEEIYAPYNIPVNTGGTGRLVETKGQHIDTHFGTPMESRTIDSTTAIGQQLQARADVTGARGGSQRTVTNAQLRRLARSVGDEPIEVLRQMVRSNPINIEELSRAARLSVDEIVADAAKGIQDALEIPGQVNFDRILTQQVGDDQLLTRAGIVQVRGLMAEVSDRLYQSSYNVMQMGEVNMDTFPQVKQLAEDLKGLMRIHKVSANAYSNYLGTYKIKIPVLGVEIPNPFKAPSAEQLAQEIKNVDAALDELVTKLSSGDPQARSEAFRLANALVLADGDPAQVRKLGKYMREIMGGQATSIMYNSMLSSPKTHLINTLSNAIQTVYRPLAAALGGDLKTKRSAFAGFYSFHQTLNDSFQMAWKTMKDGPINDGGKTILQASEFDAKLEILSRSAEVSNDAGFKAGVGMLHTVKAIAEFPLFSWPSKLLTTSDEFFKTMVSRMEFQSQTMMRAIDAAAESGKPVEEVFKKLLDEGVDQAFDPKTGAIISDQLLTTAKEITFQTDLEGWAKAFGDFVNNVPVLRPFFPFVKTGHNIMVYAGTHVPYLGQFLSEYKAVMEGTDAYAKAVMKGRQGFGTMLVTAGAYATWQGFVTGNGPPDPEERKTWLLSNQPRSLNLTKLSGGAIKGKGGKDRFMDYGRIEPFGQILSAVADIHDMFKRGQLSEDRAQYLAGYLTYAIAANFTTKSYMQGVVPLGRILTPGWQGLSSLSSLPAEVANNFIPLSGARRAFSNAMTPYMMEFNNQLDRLLYSATGSLANKGHIAYDHLSGQPIESPAGGANALLPLASVSRGGSKVREILEDVEYEYSDVMKALSGIKLEPKHRAFIQRYMGTNGLEKELEQWVTHKDFGAAVQDTKDKLSRGERVSKKNEYWYNEITRIYERHRDAAVAAAKVEFPELSAQILDRKLIRAEQKRGGAGAPAQYDFENLVNMPLR